MILIEKGREPHSLTEHKKQPYASYDNCNKDDIRASLLLEQGCLCAYCMRRITKNSMKIEHWYPESKLDEISGVFHSGLKYNILYSIKKGFNPFFRAKKSANIKKFIKEICK